uniref:Rhodanese-like domain-containing protein chloroplastic-like n=1 Tax=Tetraselmis sp. GSL018 TaxID=582737 RepID=A0A061RLE6_9CHLO
MQIYETRSRQRKLVCLASSRGGANQLNVNGKPPTSPAAWAAMQKLLEETGVKSVAPQEVASAQRRGTVVIDIRPAKDFDEYHIPGSVNVPFYRPIEGWSGKQLVRRVAFAFFGVFNGTEYNQNFVQEAQSEIVDTDKGAILVCGLGGELQGPGGAERTPRAQTRSLMAAYELANAGVRNLVTLRGGFSGWIEAGRDVSSNVHDLSS